jgi:hypothetical protein
MGSAMICNHLIGYGGDSDGGPLLESERESVGMSCLKANQRWLVGGTGVPSAVAHAMTIDTPAKALAGHFDMFHYCPRCGVKI